MGAIVTVEKLTTGTEAERIVGELERALGRGSMREGDRELDAISPTWSVHVRVVPAG